MGIEELIKQAQEYKDAKKKLEMLKPVDSIVYSIDGDLGEVLGSVAFYPLENNIRINCGNGDIKIPGRALHSLRVIFDKMDG